MRTRLEDAYPHCVRDACTQTFADRELLIWDEQGQRKHMVVATRGHDPGFHFLIRNHSGAAFCLVHIDGCLYGVGNTSTKRCDCAVIDRLGRLTLIELKTPTQNQVDYNVRHATAKSIANASRFIERGVIPAGYELPVYVFLGELGLSAIPQQLLGEVLDELSAFLDAAITLHFSNELSLP